MDKALNYLGLARKAGLCELGEEPVGAITRAGKARLVVVAKDASDHTWRRALSFVAGTSQPCLRLPFTKDEIGLAVGRTSLAIAAFTDPALALAFVKALGQPEKHSSWKSWKSGPGAPASARRKQRPTSAISSWESPGLAPERRRTDDFGGAI